MRGAAYVIGNEKDKNEAQQEAENRPIYTPPTPLSRRLRHPHRLLCKRLDHADRLTGVLSGRRCDSAAPPPYRPRHRPPRDSCSALAVTLPRLDIVPLIPVAISAIFCGKQELPAHYQGAMR